MVEQQHGRRLRDHLGAEGPERVPPAPGEGRDGGCGQHRPERWWRRIPPVEATEGIQLQDREETQAERHRRILREGIQLAYATPAGSQELHDRTLAWGPVAG